MLSFFKKSESLTISFEEDRDYTIDWLRKLSAKEYEKFIKTVEVYRRADEEVRSINNEPTDKRIGEEEFEEKIRELME